MAKDKENEYIKLKRSLTIAYVILALLVIYLIIFSSRNAAFEREIKEMQNNLSKSQIEMKTTLDKTLNSVVSDFSEKEKLISANIASCTTDISCATIFKQKNYSCAQGLLPTCINKFCKCN